MPRTWPGLHLQREVVGSYGLSPLADITSYGCKHRIIVEDSNPGLERHTMLYGQMLPIPALTFTARRNNARLDAIHSNIDLFEQLYNRQTGVIEEKSNFPLTPSSRTSSQGP